MHKQQVGSSLLELMVVVLIVAILAAMTMPVIRYQMAARELEAIGRRFIAHAHFARSQALRLGQTIYIAPLAQNDWSKGWAVKALCDQKPCTEKVWLLQESITPVFIKQGGKQFSGPNSSRRGILFNAAGAAKTVQGGFVANRLILGHQKNEALERHLILSSGGRWRMCNPQINAKACR